MSVIWDVIVVGAGPAGAAAALAALQVRPTARVLLVDRDAFPRDKVCGDGVAAHVSEVLRDLHVTEVEAGFSPLHRLHVRAAKGPDSAGWLPGGMHVIPRHVLDDRLLRAALQRGAEFERRRVRSIDVLGAEVVVDGALRARVVVGADGAESVVRRQLGLRSNARGHVAVAIRGYAPTVDADLGAVVALRPKDWPAYAWSFPIGNGTSNVGYGELVGNSTLAKEGLLAGLDELLPGVGAGGVGWRAHRLPLSTRRPRQPDGRVLLAGDAASLVNPLSGEGIFYAMRSGAHAGRAALLEQGAGGTYRRALRADLGRHLRHTSAVVRASRSPRLVTAGTMMMARSPKVFDDVVRLGMGQGVICPGAVLAGARALARW